MLLQKGLPVTVLLAAGLLAALVPSLQAQAAARPDAPRFPNVLLVVVDTLRADRLGAYGYPRDTSPHLDRLMAAGTRFEEARCVETLTGPSMASAFTSLYPHEHGASRNGLRMRPGLPSLPKVLERRGFRTIALISNWTLKDKLSGLAEHFEEFREVFTRRRWLGLANREATGDDVTEAATEWLEAHAKREVRRPFFAWVHYVEPHSPYRFHREFAKQVGIGKGDNLSGAERYDTEVAFVDRAVGELLATVEKLFPGEHTLVVFAADHGENLGEHGYWGHGRHLWEEALRVPLSVTWPGKVSAGRVLEAPASNLDLAPTVLGLLGLPVPDSFQGFDFSSVLLGREEPPAERTTFHQAHRMTVRSPKDTGKVRRHGLLEVALVTNGRHKEGYRLKGDRRYLFDLAEDGREAMSEVEPNSAVSEALAAWLATVREGLAADDDEPPPSLDEESLEQLRALGYLD